MNPPSEPEPRLVRVIVLMGVCGSGKTTLGQFLAQRLGWPFHDGDDYHPETNLAKLSRGEPLTDADRSTWLSQLYQLCLNVVNADGQAVLACSALRQTYRDALRQDLLGIQFVYLRGTRDLLASRLEKRQGHFMHRGLLDSQLETLEEPVDAIHVDISQPPPRCVQQILDQLGLRPTGP